MLCSDHNISIRSVLRNKTFKYFEYLSRKCARLFFRYRKASWQPPIPTQAHISDERIRRFVTAMKPLVLLSMYSKNMMSRLDTLFALKSLGELTPDLIVPELLDHLYPSLDSLTEPHRLTASLSAMTICTRSLFGIEGGRKHVVPLLMAVLPGIDSNDFKKSACAFQFITWVLWSVFIPRYRRQIPFVVLGVYCPSFRWKTVPVMQSVRN